jgi:hypothetical protein
MFTPSCVQIRTSVPNVTMPEPDEFSFTLYALTHRQGAVTPVRETHIRPP